MAVLTLTKDNFDAQVRQAAGKVLVDFWAPWCGPCKMIGPVVEELSQEHPELTVGKVNVDKEMQLAMEFGISSIPTLLLFEKGACTAKTIGFSTKEELEEFLQG